MTFHRALEIAILFIASFFFPLEGCRLRPAKSNGRRGLVYRRLLLETLAGRD